MLSLPPEMLNQVYTQLNNRDQQALLQLNRVTYFLIKPALWRQVSISKTCADSKAFYNSLLPRVGRYIKTVVIEDILDLNVSELLKYCPNISYIYHDLPIINVAQADKFYQLFKLKSDLKGFGSITCSTSYISLYNFNILGRLNLIQFDLCTWSNSQIYRLLEIVNGVYIEIIKLKVWELDQDNLDIIDSKFYNLKKLSLSCYQVSQKSISILQHPKKHLKELDLSLNSTIQHTEYDITLTPKHFPSLKVLAIDFMFRRRSIPFKIITPLPTIDLFVASHLPLTCSLKIGSLFPNITQIGLDCSTISMSSLDAILFRVPSLRALKLRSLKSGSLEPRKAIKSSPVTKLVIQNSKLNQSNLNFLIVSFPCLFSLSLNRVYMIEGYMLKAEAPQPNIIFQKLFILKTYGLKQPAIDYLVEKAPMLCYIEIDDKISYSNSPLTTPGIGLELNSISLKRSFHLKE